MQQLLGTKKIIETVYLLSKPFVEPSKNLDTVELGLAYRRFLQSIQPAVPEFIMDSTLFVKDEFLTEKLSTFFGETSALDDLSRDAIDRTAINTGLGSLFTTERAFFELKAQHPCFGDLFTLLVAAVFSTPSKIAGGGTTSSAIGVLWSNPRPSWSSQDIYEFFVHEFSHTVMFLDELRYGHYTSRAVLVDETGFALSAVLAKRRPLDKVLHSLVVATEVLLFREQIFGHPATPKLHPPTSLMLEQCLICIESLENSKRAQEILKPRALELIEFCKQRLLSLSSPTESSIAAALNQNALV